MLILQSTDVYQSQEKKTDHKTDFGFVILICVALGLAVAIAAVSNPAPIGNGLSSDTVYVGP